MTYATIKWTNSRSRTFAALMLGTVLASGFTGPAFAQAVPPGAPPIRSPVDENGVDLATGQFSLRDPTISIGTPGNGMAFSRYRDGTGAYGHNFYIYMTLSGNQAILFLGGTRRTFTDSGSGFVSDQGDGSTLVEVVGGVIYTYTSRDGTVITFALPSVNDEFPRAMSIQEPSGERLTFHYRNDTVTIYPPPYYDPEVINLTRLFSVTNNSGYQLKLSYDGAYIPDPLTRKTSVGSAKLINNAVEYCNPTSDSCSNLTQSWPTLDYGININSNSTPGPTLDWVIDSMGRKTYYNIDSSNRLSAIGVSPTQPNVSPYDYVQDVGVSYSQGSVSSVTVKGHSTTYSNNVSNQITANYGAGVTRTVTVDPAQGLILTDKDGLNNTTSYQYDATGRLTQATQPEGNKAQIAYDARGNVTQVTQVAKSGSGLANVVATANFDASCTNIVKCNKPNWTKDALNNQTDYTYDATTGQALTVTSPAPASGGVRPQVRLAYTAQNAWSKNSAGSTIVQNPVPISKLTSTSTCLTGASCTGTADEAKTTIAYQAGSSSVGSNILPVAVTTASGDNAISATVATSYDTVGNAVSIDGPLAGSGDTSVAKYDALRRPVGAIGPDPDGAGPLPNQASRTTYAYKGQVVLSERGTTSGQSDTAWSNFSPADSVAVSYDSVNRKSAETLKNGTAAFALKQYGYDQRGRVDCATVRMNPVVYATYQASSPGAACSLGFAGSDGNDRITQYVYDNADQLKEVRSGLGSSNAIIEKFEYSQNGKRTAVLDARNNRTAYTYDGFDRLSKSNYPDPGTGLASTTDYEQLTFNANSDVLTRRLRDASTITMTYDNLGRAISRTPTGEPVVNMAYNLLGKTTSIQRPADGLNLTYNYDSLGRLLSETQPYGSASYQYDAASRLSRLTWADGFYVNYDYDTASRMTAIRENGATTGIGVLASYSYDSLGRRSTASYGNGTSRGYAWDGANRLSGIKIDLAGTASDHIIGDVPNQCASNASVSYSSSSTYSASYTGLSGTGAGMRDAIYNTGASVHATDSTGNEWVKMDLGSAQTVASIVVVPIPAGFEGWGALYLNGAILERSTDNANWTTVAQVTGAAEGVLKTIPVNATARYLRLRKSITWLGVGDFYAIAGNCAASASSITYNPAGQITAIPRSNNAYLYTGRYNVTRAYTANKLNQYTAAGGVAMTYDARGNLTASGTSAYTYNKLNQLTSGPGAALTFDPAGRLAQYTAGAATRFAYSGASMISESSSAGAILRRYVPGPGEAPVVWYEGSGVADRRWLQGDERGSVVAVSDASGNALAINRYDEYGIPQAGNLGRFQYTGQGWFSEIGMYNYKARFYSATLGRFMQTDPIGYGDGLNWYNYVGGDPVNRTDPTGLWTVIAHKQDGGGGGSWAPLALSSRTFGGGMGSSSFGGGGGGAAEYPIVIDISPSPPADWVDNDGDGKPDGPPQDTIVVSHQPMTAEQKAMYDNAQAQAQIQYWEAIIAADIGLTYTSRSPWPGIAVGAVAGYPSVQTESQDSMAERIYQEKLFLGEVTADQLENLSRFPWNY